MNNNLMRKYIMAYLCCLMIAIIKIFSEINVNTLFIAPTSSHKRHLPLPSQQNPMKTVALCKENWQNVSSF